MWGGSLCLARMSEIGGTLVALLFEDRCGPAKSAVYWSALGAALKDSPPCVRVIDIIRGFLLGRRSQCNADARVAQLREYRRRCLPRRQSIPNPIQRQMRWVRKAESLACPALSARPSRSAVLRCDCWPCDDEATGGSELENGESTAGFRDHLHRRFRPRIVPRMRPR